METKELLIKQVESCIKTLEAYIANEEVIIATPSIVVDNEDINERKGKVSYFEVQMTDEAFINYSTGLMSLDYDPIPIMKRYTELRNKCDEIFDKRRR